MERNNENIEMNFEGKIEILLNKLKIIEDEVVLIKNDEIVTSNDEIKNNDELKILSVVSGG